MIAVVDFNHTIYDSNKYLSRFNEILGITKGEFLRTKGAKCYNLNDHKKSLLETTSLEQEAINSALEKVFAELPSFIYEDAKVFLNNFKGKKILLTRGNFDNQSLFLEKTGVKPYFEEIKIVDTKEEKAEFVRNLCESTDEEILFINDYPKETEDVIKACPRPIKSYLVERPNGSFPNIEPIEGAVTVKALTEIPVS